jgi:hypothetical protein
MNLVQQPNRGSNLTIDQIIYGPVNLMCPELPNLRSDFFLHLISMFFTYYHPSFPVLEEKSFLENLIPVNKHHPMLLNVIYAIGCNYSTNSFLFQMPICSPTKAFAFFINKALRYAPSPDDDMFSSYEVVEIAQAALLLTSCDINANNTRTLTMMALASRVITRLELQRRSNTNDFMSITSFARRFDIEVPPQQRKRMMFSLLLADLFLSIGTGFLHFI